MLHTFQMPTPALRPRVFHVLQTSLRLVCRVVPVCLALLPSALLSSALMAADAARGLQHFNSSCASCHGAQAEGSAQLKAPALAGLDDAYLLRQLRHFRDGIRGTHPDDTEGALMRAAMVSVTDDQAMQDVVAAILRMPAPVVPAASASPDADRIAGRNYYNGICSACHGSKAEGNAALHSPRLLGQRADYLLRQFEHFRSKVRGGHANDKYGAQMSKITKAIPDAKLAADVAAYIVQLNQTP